MADILQLRKEAFGPAGPAPVWYHGRLSRLEADGRLKGNPDGTYIIRESDKSAGTFVLSCAEGGKVSHYRIARTAPNAYQVGESTFKNLPEIIEFYKRHLLESTALSVPLPLEGALQDTDLEAQFEFEATALFNFNARDPEDLSFRKGEVLRVLVRVETEWWRAQSTQTRQVGLVPANYLKPHVDLAPEPAPEPEPLPKPTPAAAPEPPAPRRALPALPPEPEPVPAPPPARVEPPAPAAIDPTPALPARAPVTAPTGPAPAVVPEYFYQVEKEKLPDRPKFVICKAKMDRNAKSFDKSALSFKTGDLIHVLHQPKNGLWRGKLLDGDGKVGHFPFTLVELVDGGAYDDELNSMKEEFEVQMDLIYGTA
eukprot:TRINITY_DN4649_c0_g1_i2.p1 TRINITY_DN4649_c0_g1~~TRINITY_DN4649_c0_g1_i2.p1  ORF type:complete len:369 (+),score=96.65 TRINITY_DN4649_c0_g1_i2:127-1233(+)